MKLAIAICLAATSAQADIVPDRVSILAGSKHFGTHGYDFNEVNPGLALTWDFDRTDITVGAYRNSFNEMSYTLTVGYDLIKTDALEVGPFIGLATYKGYTDWFPVSWGDVVPVGGVQAVWYPGGPVGLSARLMPGGAKKLPLIAAFGLEMKF